MHQTAEKAMLTLVWPAVLLGATLFGLSHMHAVPTPYLPLLQWLPYAALAAVGALAWRFHSSRSLLSSVVLVGIVVVGQYPPGGPDPRVASLCMGVAVPLALTCLSFFPERGIATVHGLWRLLGVAALGLGVAHESLYPNDAVLKYVQHIDIAAVPLPMVVASGLAIIALLVRVYMVPSPFESSTVGVLVASFLAQTTTIPMGREIYLLAAACITLLSLVQHSYGMAFVDELTGIPGRRALKTELAGLSGRYTIAMVDIDHFKGFNDTYGHDVGDQCLRLVASRLAKVTGGGRVFRYGGEEFTVLFPSKAVDDAVDPLEMLRLSIERNPMVLRSPNRPDEKPKDVKPRKGPAKKVTVTVSIGVSEKTDKQGTPEEVIKNADKALYKAKKKGRNQVCKG